ncbi:MAG: type IX secretion system outer membrane channel protein PorV [Saprospiraceae bacterium]|nr:type IX secretion system outer membrane channel protein PorV [Saprospiraceae bacterium]
MQKIFLALLSLVLSSTYSTAQFWSPFKKCIIDANTGECISNTILTALPFLRINPDARSGALGDAGTALSPDPNAMHHNAARLAFSENDMGIAATYSPWLRNLGIDDIYLFYLTGFKKIDNNQSVGGGIRYFSLGEIEFRDENGMDLGTGKPNELELNLAYSRKLSEKFSASLSAKFAYSNLASGRTVGTNQVTSAKSFGADIGTFYRTSLGQSGRRNYLNLGLAITNIGSKVTYVKNLTKDFIPTNLSIGANYEMNFDDYNSLNLIGEVNKFMVPSPIPPGDSTRYDLNKNGIADFREKALFEGMLGSFGDAPGGFTEELQEVMWTLALEYWYDKQFAVRMGYFNEHALKGNRKFLTLGCGVKYNVFGLNLSYLVPTNNNRSPLANTLRFTLLFDFANAEKDN